MLYGVLDWRTRWARGAAMIAILSQLLMTNLLHPASARAAYNCLNPHCYGVNAWSGARGSFWGSSTTIKIAWSASPEINSHLTNEMWLIDNGNPDPKCMCWVEVGEFVGRTLDGSPTNVPIYFFADNRPVWGYAEHYVATVPNGNFGYNTDFEIYRNPGVANRFEVYIRSSAGDIYPSGLASTSNSMQPTTINIGEELYGTDGAFSEQARWSYNKWITSTGTRYYQTNNGMGSPPNNPPYAGWGVNELPSQSSTGGAWYADTH